MSQPPTRSESVERLRDLVAAKKKAREELRNKIALRKQDSIIRKKEVSQELQASENFGSSLDDMARDYSSKNSVQQTVSERTINSSLPSPQSFSNSNSNTLQSPKDAHRAHNSSTPIEDDAFRTPTPKHSARKQKNQAHDSPTFLGQPFEMPHTPNIPSLSHPIPAFGDLLANDQPPPQSSKGKHKNNFNLDLGKANNNTNHNHTNHNNNDDNNSSDSDSASSDNDNDNETANNNNNNYATDGAESLEILPTPLPKNMWRPRSCGEVVIAAVVCVLSCLPVAAFVLTFSGLGYGIEVHDFLFKHRSYTIFLEVAAAGILLALYLLDASYWREDFLRGFRAICIFVACACLIGACLLSAHKYPAAPMCIFVVGSPLFFTALRKFPILRSLHLATFFGFVAIGLTFASLLAAAAFAEYTLRQGTVWPGTNAVTKSDYNYKMHCDCHVCGARNQTAWDSSCCEANDCLAGFLLWFSPFIAVVVSGVFCILCYFVSRSFTSKHTFHVGLKVFAALLIVSIVSVWVASSVAAAGMGLSNTVMMFSFVGLGVTGLVIVHSIGKRAVRFELTKVPLVRRFMGSLYSDWVKALLVLTLGPAFTVYLLLSFVNQQVRLRVFEPTSHVLQEDARGRFTTATHKQLGSLRRWAWASILSKAMWLGVLFLTLDVGVSKITTVFLAWLNACLAGSFNVVQVTALFSLVGLVMFLLPPVPGVPVYVTGGVVLVNATRDSLGGFWPAVAYATVVCELIKLVAVAMQQKAIGERMGALVSVRRLVGVNSITVRAIKLLLQRPGFSWGKVAILCGGPDWPTSVLTGILRLNVWEMLLGTLPTTFLVLPCVLAGAFLLRQGEASTGGDATKNVWASLAPVTLSVAALTQMFAMLAALYYIEACVEECREELASWEPDRAVAALETKVALRSTMLKREMRWFRVPTLVRTVLILGTGFYGSSCWLIFMGGSLCFRPFQVTDSIADKLDGNVLNLVRPAGWVAIVLLGLGLVCQFVFSLWCRRALARAIDASRLKPSVSLGPGSNKDGRRQQTSNIFNTSTATAATPRTTKFRALIRRSFQTTLDVKPPQRLRIGITTWNVGNAEPFWGGHLDTLDDFLFGPNTGPASNNPTNDPAARMNFYDIVVIGLQECRFRVGDTNSGNSSANNSSLDEDSMMDKMMDRFDNGQQIVRYNVGVLMRSAGVTKYHDSSSKHMEQLLIRRLAHHGLHLVKATGLLQMRLFVFASKLVKKHLTEVKDVCEATGIMHVYGNKGGTGISMSYLNTRLMFVNAHLAAHLHHVTSRNADVKEILQGTRLFNPRLENTLLVDHLFWFGDLNYRVDLNYQPDRKPQKIKVGSDEHNINLNEALSTIRQGKFAELLQHDQLRLEMQRGAVFSNFKEGHIHFPPTFKVRRLLEPRVAGMLTGKPEVEYSHERIPSYCDRVLWHSLPGVVENLAQDSLISVPSVSTSDHVPVHSVFDLSIIPLAEKMSDPERNSQLVLHNLKCSGEGMDRRRSLTLQFTSYPSRLVTETRSKRSQALGWTSLKFNLRLKVQHGFFHRMHVIITVTDEQVANRETLGHMVLSIQQVFENSKDGSSFDFSLPLILNSAQTGMCITGSAQVVEPDSPHWSADHVMSSAVGISKLQTHSVL